MCWECDNVGNVPQIMWVMGQCEKCAQNNVANVVMC